MFLVSKYLQDKKKLSNFSGDKHQIYLNDKNVPLIGGFLLLYPILSLVIEFHLLIVFSILIFAVGFLSDTKILDSPKIRILIQIILIILFVSLDEIRIDSSRLDFFDLLLKNLFFAYFFSSFCILILINGSNFIDGLNGLLIGYTLIVLFFLHQNSLLLEIGFEKHNIFFVLFTLLFLLILNFSNKLMLGDSGAYFIALFLGYILIKSHNYNTTISPYYFIVLVWYPCFENLFSIIRKFIIKKSPSDPDKSHLHHLLFFTIKNKLKINKIFSNNISSILINSVNLVILLLSHNDPSNTKYQIILIFSAIFVYVLSYLCLLRFTKNFYIDA